MFSKIVIISALILAAEAQAQFFSAPTYRTTYQDDFFRSLSNRNAAESRPAQRKRLNAEEQKRLKEIQDERAKNMSELNRLESQGSNRRENDIDENLIQARVKQQKLEEALENIQENGIPGSTPDPAPRSPRAGRAPRAPQTSRPTPPKPKAPVLPAPPAAAIVPVPMAKPEPLKAEVKPEVKPEVKAEPKPAPVNDNEDEETEEMDEEDNTPEDMIGINDTSTSSEEDAKKDVADMIKDFQELQTKGIALKQPSLLGMCGQENPPPAILGCWEKYQGLNKPGPLKVDFFVGYDNYGNHVNDTIERAAWVEWLQRPCVGKFKVCGFTRSEDDANLIYKTVPWADGTEKRVEFRIQDSSVSMENNLNEKSEKQKAKSEFVRKQFRESLKNSDAVFYMGHSRYGGGPDFAPQRRTAERKWDHRFYETEKPGLKLMYSALNERKDPLFMLGLMSCTSAEYFDKGLQDKPVTNTLLSKKAIGILEGYDYMIGSLEGLLNQSCGPFIARNSVFQMRSNGAVSEAGTPAPRPAVKKHSTPARKRHRGYRYYNRRNFLFPY